MMGVPTTVRIDLTGPGEATPAYWITPICELEKLLLEFDVRFLTPKN
jgi:hypothetical protein